jgi:hypothetical protein
MAVGLLWKEMQFVFSERGTKRVRNKTCSWWMTAVTSLSSAVRQTIRRIGFYCPSNMTTCRLSFEDIVEASGQEVRQHWFIYSYIAAYIQALYMYCPVLLEYTRLV